MLLVASLQLTFTLAHSIPVGAVLRKKADVKYPQLYATQEQAESNPAAFTYNCAQRAHANYVENLFPTTSAMLIAGLSYPNLAAGLGVGWILARIVYLRNYLMATNPIPHGSPAPGLGTTFWLFQYALFLLSIKASFDVWLG